MAYLIICNYSYAELFMLCGIVEKQNAEGNLLAVGRAGRACPVVGKLNLAIFVGRTERQQRESLSVFI